MGSKKYNNNEFYLDLRRYTFDYLFDNEQNQLVIHLETSNDKRIMSSLLKHVFSVTNDNNSDYLLIKFSIKGLMASFVSEQDSITFIEYLKLVYKYAIEEDKKIEHLTHSKIFENIIKSGFSRLGIRKNSEIYSS